MRWVDQVAKQESLVFVQFENAHDQPIDFTVLWNARLNFTAHLSPDTDLDLRPCQRRKEYFYRYIGDSEPDRRGFAIYAAWRVPSPTELLTGKYP